MLIIYMYSRINETFHIYLYKIKVKLLLHNLKYLIANDAECSIYDLK